MTKTTNANKAFKIATYTKIDFAITLAKIWQKEFRMLSFNTLFSIAMKMDDVEFLRYCRIYNILGEHVSRIKQEQFDEMAKEDSEDDI